MDILINNVQARLLHPTTSQRYTTLEETLSSTDTTQAWPSFSHVLNPKHYNSTNSLSWRNNHCNNRTINTEVNPTHSQQWDAPHFEQCQCGEAAGNYQRQVPQFFLPPPAPKRPVLRGLRRRMLYKQVNNTRTNWCQFRPSLIDKYSRIFFPLVFLMFHVIYWSVYLWAARWNALQMQVKLRQSFVFIRKIL